jgi:hypothetical protein
MGDPMSQNFAEPEEEEIGRLLYRSRCHSSDNLTFQGEVLLHRQDDLRQQLS